MSEYGVNLRGYFVYNDWLGVYYVDTTCMENGHYRRGVNYVDIRFMGNVRCWRGLLCVDSRDISEN